MTCARPARIMGILNVTPDSFSDGGRWLAEEALRTRIGQLLDEGADIIDIGGESSRPCARPVSAAEELERVLPALRIIRSQSNIPISIDTTKAEVAHAALEAGADMINDISALRGDPAMIEVCRACKGPIVLMHMQGEPSTMQHAPVYGDVVAEIKTFFRERIEWLEMRGIDRQRLILDPGLGFGKTLAHNLAILRNLDVFRSLDRPLLIGHSRKTFLGELLDIPVKERDCPTAVLCALCAWRGVDILRVHNVRLARQALDLALACLPENTPQVWGGSE